MNKADLVNAVAEKTEMSKKDAEKAVKALFDAVSESLAKKEKVQLVGFGTFDVSARKERTGRNPATGAEIKIPATNIPVFKAGKQLKDMVNPVGKDAKKKKK